MIFRICTPGFIMAVLALSGGRAAACGIELVLAMDVSRSVVNREYDLQMGGLSAAFRDTAVIQAIEGVGVGVMVTVTQWSGPEAQIQTVPWTRLTGSESAHSFADRIDATDRAFFAAYTAIGEALVHANGLSATNPVECDKRIIDISGDGASNRGLLTNDVATALAANGVTINGLVIAGAQPDPIAFYRKNVIRGEGAFVEIADGFDDYARAIRNKLLRELTLQVAER